MCSARDAPFGNDATPETVVKIVGSKYVSCTVDKPHIKCAKNVNICTQIEVMKPPDIDTQQPTGNDFDSKDPAGHNRKSDLDCEHRKEGQQHVKAGEINKSFLEDQMFTVPNVQCLTAPSGDQTFSFIHTFKKPSNAPQTINTHEAEHLSQQKNTSYLSLLSDRENESLISAIKSELKLCKYSEKDLDIVKEELKRIDPTKSGVLRQSQLHLPLLRNKFPLNLPTILLLFQKFAKPNQPELVNYEKLLGFVRGYLPKNQEPHKGRPTMNQEPGVSTKSLPFPAAEERISRLLSQAMKECTEAPDPEKIRLIFEKKDQSHSGLLPAFQIVFVCQQHGLPISLPLLKEMLFSQHLCVKDSIRWQKFVELLHKAQSELSPRLPEGKEKESVSSVIAPCDGPVSYLHEQPDIMIIENNGNSSRATTQPSPLPAESKKEHEVWIDRFGKLENALHLCDMKNTGMLEKERAKRLIHNYNQIYNLALNPLRIENALQKFHCGDNVALQPVLQYLKEI